jgi:two-component system, NarL family, invasion response regulator UvrY
MIRVMIADDHVVVRMGLSQIIAADTDMFIAGEAASGYELLDLLRPSSADVIVLDINMPGLNGLDTLQILKRDHPQIGVIIMSMHSEEQYAVRALKAGASGYMSKEAAVDDLIQAIKVVFTGKKYISPKIAELLADHIGANTADQPHLRLSNRELQVFQLLADGRTVGQIAEDLNLSVKTISTYRTRILEKTGMQTNADLTRYALDNSLI